MVGDTFIEPVHIESSLLFRRQRRPKTVTSGGTTSNSSTLADFLPPSLRTTTRYGKEPHLQSIPTSGRRRRLTESPIAAADSSAHRWRPRAVQQSRRRGRKVVDAECQCSPRGPAVHDASTQTTTRRKLVDQGLQTTPDWRHELSRDASVQAVVEMTNKMVETLVSVVEYPDVDYSTAAAVRRAKRPIRAS